MWVPAHVGIACNAYADAVATAHLGDNDTEDASGRDRREWDGREVA